MTAIPAATEEDFKWLEFYRSRFGENTDIPFDQKCHPESRMWFRLWNHVNEEATRLFRRCEDLEEHIGRTADGVCFMDLTEAYCPHCGNRIDKDGGDSFTAYCWNCTNPDDGCWPHRSPLPMSWDNVLSKPKEKTE